jgi:Bacterial TSP3 repeat
MFDWIDEKLADKDPMVTAGGRHHGREAGDTQATVPTTEQVRDVRAHAAVQDAADWIEQKLVRDPRADAAHELADDLAETGRDSADIPVVGGILDAVMDTLAGGIHAAASLNDRDRDGLTDGQEARLGTNPRDADSDHDGVSDSLEVRRFLSDPLSTDTDRDGLSDGVEAGANAYQTLYQDTDYLPTDDLITPLPPPLGAEPDVGPVVDEPSPMDDKPSPLL